MPVSFNFGIIQFLMFACAAAVIVFIFVKGLSEKNENNNAPVQTVYARIGTMCIYEVGEEVELMEKDGYHRFLGNDRVNAKGKKELLWGTIPLLVIIIGVAVLSAVF
jgi:hypothetical protein